MQSIINSDLIKELEKDLVEKLDQGLDKETIKQVLEEQLHVVIKKDIEFLEGNIIVHDNKKAFKMTYEIKLPVEIILDSDGNYMPPGKIEEVGSQVEKIADEFIQNYLPEETDA
ncbi:MAG: hypothetical protein HQK76_06080 [Desulfobacterales bacterium]|nr:hypothetical protein [Desulfobacterales bacterium]